MVKKEVFQCGCYRVSGNFNDDSDREIGLALASVVSESLLVSRNAEGVTKDLDLILNPGAGVVNFRLRIPASKVRSKTYQLDSDEPKFEDIQIPARITDWRTAPTRNLSDAMGYTRESAISDFGNAHYQLLEDPQMPLQQHIYGDGVYKATLQRAQLAVKLEERK